MDTTKAIQVAVAWADIIVCGIGQALALLAGWVLFAVLLFIVEGKHHGR